MKKTIILALALAADGGEGQRENDGLLHSLIPPLSFTAEKQPRPCATLAESRQPPRPRTQWHHLPQGIFKQIRNPNRSLCCIGIKIDSKTSPVKTPRSTADTFVIYQPRHGMSRGGRHACLRHPARAGRLRRGRTCLYRLADPDAPPLLRRGRAGEDDLALAVVVQVGDLEIEDDGAGLVHA